MTDPDAPSGLRTVQIDPADRAALRAWWDVVGRGFLGPIASDQTFDEVVPAFETRRTTGVYDDTAAEPEAPVGTVVSWPTELTLPGGATVGTSAVTYVTVAPTHRRRGIARSLLEGELRAAAEAGLPTAVLTVSESTLYGRYGFGPATWAAELKIDTRAAGWSGHEPGGRVHIVSRDRILADAPAVADRVRRRNAGGVLLEGIQFTRDFGRPSDDTDLRTRRFLRYDDADGVPQGYAIYRTTPNDDDYPASRADVDVLAAATDEALASLWRFVLSFDLIGTVVARMRPIDDPVHWLVANPRSIHADPFEHLYVRVLDVPRVLEARAYERPGSVVLDVRDPLGYAAGRFRLTAGDDGRGRVEPVGDGAEAVGLGVDALGSLLLGGVSTGVLAAAGRITGDAAAIRTADGLFRTARQPWIAAWF